MGCGLAILNFRKRKKQKLKGKKKVYFISRRDCALLCPEQYRKAAVAVCPCVYVHLKNTC